MEKVNWEKWKEKGSTDLGRILSFFLCDPSFLPAEKGIKGEVKGRNDKILKNKGKK